MKPACLNSLLAIAVALFVSAPARAQPLFGSTESLEALVAQSDLVVVGKIVGFAKDTRIATIAVAETLKGKQQKQVSVHFTHNVADLAKWKQEASRLLVPAKGNLQIADRVLDLDDDALEVMTADFAVLRKPADVLRVAREAARRQPMNKLLDTFALAVPSKAFMGTQWARRVTNLSLIVPVDERLEKWAHEYIRSKSYREREMGTRALARFKSDANIARMKLLLNEPEWVIVQAAEGNRGIDVRLCTIRQVAHEALLNWGTKTPQPDIQVEVLKRDIETLTVNEMTDQLLDRLCDFKKLRELFYYQNLSDDGVRKIAALKQLQRLTVYAQDNKNITDAGIKDLKQLTNLTHLLLQCPGLTDAGLRELAPLKNLTTLYLVAEGVRGAGLKDLAPLKNLTTLELFYPALNDASLRNLRAIDLLHALNLATAKDGARPKSADEVIAFDLSSTVATDAGLKELASFKNLTTLSLPAKVTDAGLKEVAQFKNLTTLHLGYAQVTGAGLRELTQLKNLSSLFVPFTDSSLRAMREIGLLHLHRDGAGTNDSRPKSVEDVVALSVRYSKVGDAGLKELAPLKNLTKLNLEHTKVTDAGLHHLAAFPKLRSLDLRDTQVTDEGLKHLVGLSELRELFVAQSKVTDAGVFALRKALPKCRIATR